MGAGAVASDLPAGIVAVETPARVHGIEDVSTVKHAYIEPNGMISVVRRDAEETEPVEPTAI